MRSAEENAKTLRQVSQRCASLHKAHEEAASYAKATECRMNRVRVTAAVRDMMDDDNPQAHIAAQLQPFQELPEHFFYYNLLQERMKHCNLVFFF